LQKILAIGLEEHQLSSTHQLRSIFIWPNTTRTYVL